MEIKFKLTDEKTLTNNTVKIETLVGGFVGTQTKEQMEAALAKAVADFLPTATWSFSNWRVYNDNMGITMFSIKATTRIENEDNDKLAEKALAASTPSCKLIIQRIDSSIPLYQMREGEEAVRDAILVKAHKECQRLSKVLSETAGSPVPVNLKSVDFTDDPDLEVSNMRGMAASATYQADSKAASIGHSEKIKLTATLVFEV